MSRLRLGAVPLVAANGALVAICAMFSWKTGVSSSYLDPGSSLWVEAPWALRVLESVTILLNFPSWFLASSGARYFATLGASEPWVHVAWIAAWTTSSVFQWRLYVVCWRWMRGVVRRRESG